MQQSASNVQLETASIWHVLVPLVQAMLCASVLTLPAHAGQLSLSQAPAGNGGREPAPNIIVSVDDSGSMGTTGIAALKAALNNAFSSAAVADDSIRLGFQAMWRCRGFGTSAVSNYGGVCPENRVRPFSGSHRTGFNTWVNSLQPSSMTPSHLMIKNAGEFMKTTGIWNPYASVPGTTETPMLACRKSFQVFMTDGEWNSEASYGNNPGTAGNADGVPRVLPDGTVYDPYNTDSDPAYSTETQTRVYRDTHGTGTVNTVADFVFDYWATDLQPAIPNEVRPIIKAPGAVNAGTTASPFWLQEFWNPRNNPATWQSLTTYTIGFGSGAALSTSGASNKPWWGGATGTTWSGGDYTALVLGNVNWGNPIASADAKRKELWHMAINGRGRYVSASNAAELGTAFSEIINQVIADSSAPLTTLGANTQTVTSGTRVYIAGYDASKWSGYLQAKTVSTNYTVSTTPLWDAALVLEATTPSARTILTHNGASDASAAGTAFTWTSGLTTAQKNALKGTDNDTVGQERLDYLRGDRSKEVLVGGAYRNRDKRLGDIVNSNLWVVGKPDMGYADNGYSTFRTTQVSRLSMVYVGANDGMLHGFSTADGSEKLAYVPLGVYGNLKGYTEPSYPHKYYVDGHPFTGDIQDGTAWKTMLIGSLAGGGKGYFALDVTNPGTFGTAMPSSIVALDKTDGADADIGHIFSEPTLDTKNSSRVVQITKMNNGRWAVLMGNGINSTSEKAVLLIQYLDQSKELIKIEMDGTGGNGNGLSNPQVIDINGDGKADLAYAGDLLGNLWKIDLTSGTASNWKSYYLSGTTPVPLFVARDTANTRQAITTAPQWATHPVKGLMIAFGTGREMTVGDRTSTSPHTLYAIWDDTTINTTTASMMSGGAVVANGRADLVEQTQMGTVTLNGQQFFKTTSNAVPYTGTSAKRGWYMEWPGLGERAVNNGGMLTNQLLFMRSRMPASGTQTSSSEESCVPNATAANEFLTVLNIVTGQPPSKPVFDTDGGGFTGSEESGVSRWQSGREDRLLIGTGKPGEAVSINGQSNGNPMLLNANLRLMEIGWRQLQ